MIKAFFDTKAGKRLLSPKQGAAALCPGTGARLPLRARKLTFVRSALLLLLFVLCQISAASGASPVQGSRIVNSAQLSLDGLPPVNTSVSVTVAFPFQGQIEFLKYAPQVASAESLRVAQTWYRTGSDENAPLAAMPAPVAAGSSTPLDLTQPLPLAPAQIFHQCEPVFVKLTDWTSNLDPARAETVMVTITSPSTGDVEVLRLTETGISTGIFTGYIQSAGSACSNNPPAGTYSGFLPVTNGDKITASFTSAGSTGSTTSEAVVDPYGIVFDSVSGKPVDGAVITLIDVATGKPATVFGDDGLSTFPAVGNSITSGGTALDSSSRRYDFPPGQFRFPFVRPGNYRFQVTPPAGYVIPSSASDAQLAAVPGGPFTLAVGSRLETFTVNPGPAIHIDIPVDPLPAALWLQKTAGKSSAGYGDFVPYQLVLQNNDTTVTAKSLTVTDTLPTGFRYRAGSTTLDGSAASDPTLSADGRTLTFALADLAPKGSTTIKYVVEVSAGAVIGKAVNLATAHSFAATSNLAQATVLVQSDFMDSRSILMGRVERGPCDLDWDEGVEGVRIYLEDGTFVNTDKRGMFHFEGVTPGTHVVQLDLDSLPEGYEVYRCEENSRFAGRAFSQFVDTQGGTMWRVNFRAGSVSDAAEYRKRKAELAAAKDAARLKAEQAAARLTEERLKKEAARAKAAKEAKEEKEEEEAAPADDWATPATPAPSAAAAAKAPGAPMDEWADTPPEAKSAPPAVAAPAPAAPSAAALELASTLAGKGVLYTAVVALPSIPVQKAELEVELPKGLAYRHGSASKNGETVADPASKGTTLTFPLPAQAAQRDLAISFAADFAADAPSGEFISRALVTYGTEKEQTGRTPYADNVLTRIKAEERADLPVIVVRPNFATFEDQLGAEDRKMLDETALVIKSLSERGVLGVRQLLLVGHTDNVRIAPRSRRVYRDNTALSIARARTVALYLKEHLGLTPAQISVSGSGQTAPIASNKTAEGRALNRRVEVVILPEKHSQRVDTRIIKERGAARAEIAPPATPGGAAKGSLSAEPQSPAAPAAALLAEAPAPGAVAAPTANAAHPAVPFAGAAASRILIASAESAQLLACVPQGGAEVTACAPPTDSLFTAAAAEALPATPAEEKAPEKEEARLTTVGIIAPAEGAALPDPISAVRVVLPSELAPQLLLDGVEIPADRIGFTLKDNKTDKTLYSYIGINFGAPGTHTVTLRGKDTFGIARVEKSATVSRVGAIAAIRLVDAQGNVADGKTPVRLKFELFDAAGAPIRTAVELELKEGNLKPLKKENMFPDPVAEGKERVAVSADGSALFQPVNAGGPYRVVLAADKVTVEAETYVKPKLRDWILVGLAEGTVGYNAVAGHMENLSSSGADENLYENDRIAFYGKGTVQGKWLMTMAYDSAKSRQEGNTLFQTINPETFFTLYGDASQQQYDAASARKLYLKIEREQFYALFGDFDTNLTVTELSRYSRRLNGIHSEYQGKTVEANLFGADTAQAYARDEIQGDGTSGLYHLTQKPIVLNSEKITIQVRDRFRSEIIVSSKVLGRFTDYSIDYDAGTIFFREPIHSRDENFNPIFIVAEYETGNAGEKALSYGGRVGVKLVDNKVKTGVTYLHEGHVNGSGDSFGVDATLKLTPETTLRTEAARTVTDFGTDARHGNAFLAEVKKQSPLFQGKAYFRELANGFGLGQQNGSETGTRKFGTDGSYKLTDSLSLAGELYRQYNLGTGALQDLAELKSTYGQGPYNAHLGVRYASDTLGDGSRENSYQLTSGASWLTLDKRLTLRADHDQSIGENGNATYPTRTVFGADYAITKQVTATAQQEFTSGGGAETSTTRVGLKATPWNGGTVNTTMQRELSENGDRVFALFGLKQSLKITDKWSVDGGIDRSQTVRNASNYTFNVNVPPASGSTEDFTAVSLGSNYQEKKWNWNNRVEYRTATSQEKRGIDSAFLGEPKEGWGYSARVTLFDTSTTAGDKTIQGDLRMGVVYRPLNTRWIILDRLDLIYNKQETSGSNLESRRLVNNLNANYRPTPRAQISLQYGAKYALETIENAEYSSYTDLVGAEGRYDLTKKWDVGLRGSLLHSWGTGQAKYSVGGSVGYNVMENAWVSLGYNLIGFTDQDFSASDYTAQGPYMKFRMKFDQNSGKDAVKWVNQ